MADEVKVTITADDRPFRDAIGRANGSVDEFGRRASEAFSSSNTMLGSLTQTSLAFAAGQFIFQGISSAIGGMNNFLRESVAAFSEQEEAINKLAQSYNITGNFSQKTIDSVQEFASTLQKNSKFADESVLAQVAFARSLGATTEQAKNLVLAAANMSATIGGSLEENVDKLGKTLSGTTGRLGQYIPELKNLTESQLRAGAAADIVNSKFSGAAQNDLKTYTGSIASTKNAFNDLQEEIGRFLVKNSLVESAVSISKEIFGKFAENIKAVNDGLANPNGLKKIGEDASDSAKRIVVLNKEIEQTQDQLKLGLIGNSLDPDAESVESLRLQLTKLNSEKERLQSELPYKKDTTQPVAETTRGKSEEEIKDAGKRNAELLGLRAQYAIQENAIIEQASIANIQAEGLRNQLEIERIARFEQEKAAAIEIQKISIAENTLKGEALEYEKLKIKEETKLTILESSARKQKTLSDNLLKTRQSSEAAMDAYDKKEADKKLADKNSFYASALSLQSSSNKELAAVGKAFAIQQATMQGYEAINASYRFGSLTGGPILGAVFAAIAATATASNIANIAGVKFETGGVVPGLGQYGDQVQARLNPGEVVLNHSQQKELLDVANGRSNSTDSNMLNTIVDAVRNISLSVVIDGREIAKTVRDQRLSGYAI